MIGFDNRGHGQSEKLYEPERYGAPIMAEDARDLLDHLGIERADVLGYSMGARISAFLVLKHPARVRSVIFAGLGINMVRGMVGTGRSPRRSRQEASRGHQRYGAELQGVCRAYQRRPCALAACMRGPREKITPEMLAGIHVPVLVAVEQRT